MQNNQTIQKKIYKQVNFIGDSKSNKTPVNDQPIVASHPRTFVSYPYMIAIMSVLQVLTIIFGGNMFTFFAFKVSSGWLILMPLMFYIFQIVAECYGWQYARQIMWCNFRLFCFLSG